MSSGSRRPAEPLHGKTILVVDDAADSRELLAYVFARSGALVREAESAEAALEIIDATPVDLVVTDIAMPARDGYALMRDIRRRNIGADVRSVALSAFHPTPDRLRCARDAGFDLFLSKPIDPPELVASIAALLRSSTPTGADDSGS